MRRIPAFGRAGARPRRRRLLSRRRRAERLERQRRVCGALAPGRVVPQALAGAAVVEVRRAVALGLAGTAAAQTALFPVHGFGGGKSVVLSTMSFMGGKNPFLGVAYVVVGAVCLALALLFCIKDHLSPRKIGRAHV